MGNETYIEIADPELDLEDSEEQSQAATPTPKSTTPKRQLSSTSKGSIKHDFNINYGYTLSVIRPNGEEVDVPNLLKDLAKISAHLQESPTPTKAILNSRTSTIPSVATAMPRFEKQKKKEIGFG